jgi:hypothetical protein
LTGNLLAKLNRPRWRIVMVAAGVAIPLAYLSYWAGVPQKGVVAFVIGLGVFLGLTLACGWLAWRFLFRTESGEQAGSHPMLLGPGQRRLLALVMAMGSLALMVGGFWDEIWHRKYGLPFGEDLLWRPHLLIYFGLLMPPVLAAVTLVQIIERGEGRLPQRLRSDPGMSLLVLLGAFLLLNVPADPIWHVIYGEDISAWSLPHLVLMLCAGLLALLGAFFQLSTVESREAWRPVWALPWAASFVLVFFTCALSIMAQVLIGDFAAENPMALIRPFWLLPTLITALAILMGTMVNHTTRSFGAATAVGLLAVATRFALVRVFNFGEISAGTWLPIVPPLVALDLWYAFRTTRGRPPARAAANGLAALAGAAVSIWMIPSFYTFLHYDAMGLGVTLLIAWAVGSAANGLGKMAGDSLATASRDAQPLDAAFRQSAWVGPLLFGVAVLFIICFVATAVPPIHTF